jgi:hypothetical protein
MEADDFHRRCDTIDANALQPQKAQCASSPDSESGEKEIVRSDAQSAKQNSPRVLTGDGTQNDARFRQPENTRLSSSESFVCGPNVTVGGI